MAYDPNQAGLFNKLIQTGLNTANAALQSGIAATKDFALGNNGNLGALIPGANSVPATAQSTFQSVDFAQTFSGRPIQMAALAANAAALPASPVPVPAPVAAPVAAPLPVGIPEQTEQEAQTEAAFVASRQALPVGIPEQTPEEARNEAALVAASAPAPVEVAGDRRADGQSQFLDPEQRGANQQAAAEAKANQQAAIQSTYKQPGNTEWRFRISLAENANYLYKVPEKSPNNSNKAGGAGFPGAGILEPLRGTNGVIFPYTPTVQMSYRAKYNSYELVHSNYRGAFYQNSSVDDISIRGTFTAQDTNEAAYMLAVIHFFRSVTKMFYGQDAQRGAPPPLVYLSGLGEYQFSNHPAVVTSFDYSLPADVDYIRANNPNNFGTDLLSRRPSYAAPPSNPLSAKVQRMITSFLNPGAESKAPSLAPLSASVSNTLAATYVPTKIEIILNLMPMQTRDQVSKQFSLAKFANGDLIKGGFW